jgi:predicted transcriptional regulator
MNKQNDKNEKTPHNFINIHSILSIYFTFKQSRDIRQRFNINPHSIVVLVMCYVYSNYVKSLFTIGAIYSFNNTYNYNRLKKYIGILVDINLITQSGINKYSMTDLGISAIHEISQKSESLIYEFCNRYGIEL